MEQTQQVQGQAPTGEFSTSDQGMAAYLLAKGYKVLRVDSPDGDRWRCFVFEDVARAAAYDFLKGGEIGAKLLLRSYRDVRSLTHILPGRVG